MINASSLHTEYLDILDEDGNQTNVSVSIQDAHEKGLLHRSVHVWLTNSLGQLLLQKRSPNMHGHPNQWDISAAGHVSAGESSVVAALTEIEEELGLRVHKDDLISLGTIRNRAVLNEGTRIDNEFQDIYIVHLDVRAEDINFQESEVTAVRWITIPELKEWVAGKGETIVSHEEEYKRLFEYLEHNMIPLQNEL